MKIFGKILFFCLAVVGMILPVTATAVNELQMHYALNEQGHKIFGCHWFETKRIGICNLGLEWNNKGPNEFDYILDQSKSQHVVSPMLPNDCILKKFGGRISSQPGSVQQISLQFRGASCGKVIEAMRISPIRMKFIDVPSEAGGGLHAIVLVGIDDVPGSLG